MSDEAASRALFIGVLERIAEETAQTIRVLRGQADSEPVTERAYDRAELPPGVWSPVPDLPPTESIQRDALDALHSMLTNKSAAIMDHYYAVREREGEGWEGPDMVAWGAAMEKAQDVLKRAGRML